MQLSTEDKERIEQEAKRHVFPISFKEGAEYEHKYQQEENERLTRMIRNIRHCTYAKDTDDAILHDIETILTLGGFPYESED